MKLSLYDQAIIKAKNNLSLDDLSVLALLYQPIIGMKAYSIYMSFYAFLYRTSYITEVNHKKIIDTLNLSINIFEEERKKLEAVGLIKTLYDDINDKYIYELYLPLSAKAFFDNNDLGKILYLKVLNEQFEFLKSSFKIDDSHLNQFQNISEKFNNVFKENLENVNFLKENLVDNSKAVVNHFDIILFKKMLSPTFFDINKVNEKVIHKITEIAKNHQLNEEDMVKLCFMALDSNKQIIDCEKLDNEVITFLNKKDNLPKIQKNLIHSIEDYQITDLIPKEVGHITEEQKAYLFELKEKSGFSNGVYNAMIMYIFEKTDKKFPAYNYFERVLDTWKKQKLYTIDDAINFLKKKKKTVTKNPNEEKWLSDFIDQFVEEWK